MPLNATDTLRWLTETASIADLPVLPQVHAGAHARVTFRRPIDDERQQLIRLWDSGTRVEAQEERVPVWLGIVTEQRARSYYRLFRYPVTEAESPPLPPLFASTANTALRAVERNGHRVWLMGAPRVLYTSPIPEAPVGPPVPLPP